MNWASWCRSQETVKPRGRGVLLAGLALALVLAVACGGGGGGSSGDLLKLLPPDDTDSVAYVDIPGAVKALEDHRRLRNDLEDEWDRQDFAEDLDIDVRDLDYVAYADTDDGYVVMFGGVDEEDLRDALDDEDYDDDEIRDVEAWLNPSRRWEAFAFVDGAVLAATNEDLMEDMLRRRDRDSSSFHDEAGDLWGAVPAGVAKQLEAQYCGSGCLMVAWSVEDKGPEDLKLTVVGEYEDEDEAEDFHDEVEHDGLLDCDDVDADLDGEQVRVEGNCDIDVLGPLFDF